MRYWYSTIMRKLKIILIQFNKAFMPLNIVVSLYLIRLLLKYQPTIIYVSQAVFAKLGFYGLIVLYQWYMQNKNWYYYRNAGFSIKLLFIYSFLIDLLMFMITYVLIYSLHKR